jgi:cytosine/adenosine deaminase-related metal-dependent hydrolase
METRAFHADGVVTGDREPIRDGAVIVAADGTIVDVGSATDVLPRHAGVAVTRVKGAVLPGLVNAHTHVELSALRGQVPGGAGFVAWVDRLIGARAELESEQAEQGIESGVRELESAGTAAVGEVTNGLGAVHALARAGIGGSIFHETFGLRRARVIEAVGRLASARDEAVGAWPTADLAYAPAPHTLYTTHPDAVRALLGLARERGARSTLHIAEHSQERRALEQGDGQLVAWLEDRMKLAAGEVAWPRRGPIDYAEDLGALAPDVLLVHLTDARPEELERVARRGAPVVLCPRSNLFIDLKLPPLVAMRAAGIEPALGTDSLASNASLDVLAEARALADRFAAGPPAHGPAAVRATGPSPRDLLQMATWNGARALGRKDLGRIAPGARPGLVAIDGNVGDDPCAFVLESVRARAPRRWLVRRPSTGAARATGGAS